MFQYIIAILVAAGVAFWYDFKSWQSSGTQIHHYHYIASNSEVIRYRRYSSNSTRLSQDPPMGNIPTLHTARPP
jgi:hypothetical protein